MLKKLFIFSSFERFNEFEHYLESQIVLISKYFDIS